MKRKRDWKFFAGCLVSAAAFGIVVGFFLTGMSSFLERAQAEGAKTLQNGITRACVQCYAIEGRYPPSVQYLEDHYGVQIDEKRYHVFYDGFASNLMPDITVIPADGQ
ncbi:MAG: hypothetical protein HFG60_13125 [Lachnospiraceae bacterium]|nr:hypothetical protein [Lachnospiraceae bacterium]MCI9184597.1 hypothetical protein [Lachnospiraceae bacterium]